MALKKLKKEDEELLRKATDSRGSQSYTEWLGVGGGESDSAHKAHAMSARRTAVGYGRGGEELSRSDLADDGYAAYLRRAAKEARDAGHLKIERGRSDSQLASLGAYAEYLDGERKKKADRLVSLAEELLGNAYDNDTAESLIKKSGAGATASGLLRGHQSRKTPYEETPEGREAISEVLNYLSKSGIPYKRAYEYCRLLGYGDQMAHRLASYADGERSDLSQELEDLFNR